MSMMNKNLTSVRGITCWGAHSGIKSMRRDLAIIKSDVPASAAGVFTQNSVVAEPVKLTKEHIKSGIAQVIVCNAGNANACTGKQGFEGALAMAETTAEALNIEKEKVLVASTGLIGEPFPTDDIVKGIKENMPKLTNDLKAGSFAANAILTTDTFAKEGFQEFELDGRHVNLSGIAKGSGMIHPNMATMLSFIVSDVNISPEMLQKALKHCVDVSFNMITVDGDTSTNDMVLVLANGLAENRRIESEDDPLFYQFRDKLEELMIHLAELIISDGEGASKFIEYEIVNAENDEKARKLARTISVSSLVKTAMFGRDPNWGRIVCAAGNSGTEFNYEKADLFIGDKTQLFQVLDQGKPISYDKNYLKKMLRESHIRVKLVVNEGEANAKAWGTDLTTDYVLFNSVYTT